jgi:MHS family proline/betaine transporter-like MFS transporter
MRLIYRKQKIIISIIGNILEWYDFTVFAFFAPIIGRLFFPAQNSVIALIKAFGIFAIGFLVRPIGGLLFGHLGDRYGRNKTLQLSIFMMTIPTVLIGFIPVYKHIGYLAPILLLVLRIIQGISAGGELMGSTSYVFEIAPQKRKGYWGSWVTTSSMAGVLMGSLIVTLFHAFVPYNFLLAWGWRIPFYLGSLLGVLGIIMRSRMTETPMFAEVQSAKEISKQPLVDVVVNEFPMIIQIVLINIFVSVAFYVLFIWMPSYLRTFMGKAALSALLINSAIMVMLIFLTPLAGILSDKIGWKKQALFSVFSVAIFAYPLFTLISSGKLWEIIIAEIIFVFFMCGIEGVLSAIMASIFSTKVRFSGLVIGYNFSTAIFGGTAPLLCTYLIHKTGSLMVPAIYLVLAAVVSIPAFIYYVERA